jgi:hypothetical protein
MSQQTAIDAIIEKLHEQIKASAHGELGTKRTGEYRIGLTKAITICYEFKEMQKQQHEGTALAMIEYAIDKIEGKNNLNGKDAFEQYYNENYEQ